MLLELKLKEIDSTQLELKRRLSENSSLAHLSYIQAERQTGGKGRQERAWSSPEGNLFVSILLRGPHASVTWVPLWVAVSLRNALISTFDLEREIKLKWPNDLIIEPFSKLSGILCEKVGDHIIAGIGVNVALAPEVEGRSVVAVKDLVSESLSKNSADLLRDAILNELKKPLSIDTIRREFDLHGLMNQGDEIEWLDVGTQKAGSGRMIGLGPYGELQVQQGDHSMSLFSEEITQIKKR